MSPGSLQELPVFADGIVGFSELRRPHLLGSYCPRCDRWAFPWMSRCRHCQQSVEPRSLGSSGSVYSFTTVRSRPPLGFPQPYPVAYVDLDATPLRVFMPLDPLSATIGIGLPVALRVGPLGVNAAGARCLRPFFTPLST